jgi:hypothetical protein
MKPNERLDQLEPLLADSLQKIDRLIEGQGKIIDLATRTEQRVSKIEQKVDTTAQAVAKLTVSTQKQYEELKVGQEAIMQYLREKLP